MALKKFAWDKFQEKVKTSMTKKSYKDVRMWEVTKNDAGSGSAIIRFIPSLKCDDPFTSYFNHGFKYMKDGAKKWYIKYCGYTVGKDCPVCNKNREYWDSPYDSDKDIARERKAKKSYVANILVIKDPGNPENDGKVFLFRYGKKIHDKIMNKWMPEDTELLEEGESFMPFDPTEGANFKLIIKKVDGYPNYDTSEFAAQSQIAKGNEKQIMAILEQTYDLSEWSDPKNYPEPSEVLKELGDLLGESAGLGESDESEGDDDGNSFMSEDDDGSDGTSDTPEEAIDDTNTESKAAVDESTSDADEEEDEDMAFFANLGKK